MKILKLLFLSIVLFFAFLFFPAYLGSQDCTPPPPPGPPPDNADDNYSYNTDGTELKAITPILEQVASIGIFNTWNFEKMDNILGRLGNSYTNVDAEFDPVIALKHLNAIIIPTGGLLGLEKSEIGKFLLKQYILNGGTIIVFAQQNGSHFDEVIPVPDGEQLKSYGWREDQSCTRNSSLSQGIHPVLTSLMNEKADVGVDGYFSQIPAGSTVLLRKATNDTPVLLYYSYGNGTVILTSMFTDWAHAHSQASTAELNLIRDLITFAKNPSIPIAMNNVTDNPTPTISRTLLIENTTEQTVSKVKIAILNPNKTAIIFEKNYLLPNFPTS